MSPENPAKVVKQAAGKVAGKVAEMVEPAIPGAPAVEPPALDEPTEPRAPLPPKTEQDAPDTRTATGAETGAPQTARSRSRASTSPLRRASACTTPTTR